MRRRVARLLTGAVVVGAAMLGAARSAEAGETGATAPAAASAAKDAGVRYGQALGVLEVCYGSKLTDKGKALESTFSGEDLAAFKAAAAGVYDAWVKVRACTNQKDPNTCKIIMDKSCLAAMGEIGPKGSAMPDLVEFTAP